MIFFNTDWRGYRSFILVGFPATESQNVKKDFTFISYFIVSATFISFLMFLVLNSLFASYFLDLDMTKQPKFCLLNSSWTRRAGVSQFSWAVLAHSQQQLLWNSSSSPLQHCFGSYSKIFSCLIRKVEYLSTDTSPTRSISTLEAKCLGENLLLMLLQLL